MSQLAEWKDFYVIVGSAAAVLIGLQFVVLTIAPTRPGSRSPELGSAVATPTVVHLGTVLLLAALVAAPWKSVSSVAVLNILIGLAGLAYMIFVLRRMQLQTDYEPVFEDWLFHILLPFAAYTILTIAAVFSISYEHYGLFGVAAAALLLLFIAIHNAWDSIAYLVFTHGAEAKDEKDSEEIED